MLLKYQPEILITLAADVRSRANQSRRRSYKHLQVFQWKTEKVGSFLSWDGLKSTSNNRLLMRQL